MRCKMSLIFIFVIATVATVYAQDTLTANDTLPPPPMNPTIELMTESIEYSGINLGWSGTFYPDVIFFEPGSHELNPSYKPILNYFADCLVQNPDVSCQIRGYYSPTIDDIDSPSVGEDLAYMRAMAVREILVLRHSQLGLRVSASLQGFDYSRSFLDSTGRFDPRVEFVPEVEGWTPRVIVSSPNLPYWRRGFRSIAESESDKLVEILSRNPDLNLVFSSGLLEVPAVEAYDRVETVVNKFRKEMEWEDHSRLVAVYGGNSEDGELLIDLKLAFCGPQPWNKSLLWLQPEDYSAPEIDIHLGSDTLSDVFAYRVVKRSNAHQSPVIRGFGDYPGRLEIEAIDSTSILLPGETAFSLLLWRSHFDVEQSEWKTLEIAKSHEYYEMAAIPMINFTIDEVRPAGYWETALEPVARRIQYLTESDGELRLTIIGHAADFENGIDTLAMARAKYLWKRLSDRLIVLLKAKNLDDLGKIFTDSNVIAELSQEFHTFESGQLSTLPVDSGPIKALPKDHIAPWVPFATIKWEFRSHE